MLITTVLTFLADHILGTLVGKISEDLYGKLRRDPTQKAFEQALGNALRQYAKGEHRMILARPWLAPDGLASDEEVCAELAQLLRFDQHPDCPLIGARWRAAVSESGGRWDFEAEARTLTRLLEAELRGSAAFQPAFIAKDLQRIQTDVLVPQAEREQLVEQLAALTALLETQFGRLTERFAAAGGGLQPYILDQSWHVAEKTQGFVGRQWVFDAIDQFLRANPRGYFFIKGDPGIGKTALAAQYVKVRGAVHHFNIQAQGINRPEDCLPNLCAQLTVAYHLSGSSLPPHCGRNASHLVKLLAEVAHGQSGTDRCVIVLDALDESAEPLRETNPLCLPENLPQGIYFVVTMRHDALCQPRIDCEQGGLNLGDSPKNNLQDITDFLAAQATRPALRARLEKLGTGPEDFVRLLAAKSEGNFMYLRHVLPEIEGGRYQSVALASIPQGLQNYYRDHWRRMRGFGTDEQAWFEFKLPVILALTAALQPLPLELIAAYAGVSDRRRVQAVLAEWSAFLHDEEVEYGGRRVRAYCLYHSSFREFVQNLEEVKDERVDLKAAYNRIGKVYDDRLRGTRTSHVRQRPVD